MFAICSSSGAHLWQWFRDLRRQCSDYVGGVFKNKTALLALYLDPCYKGMDDFDVPSKDIAISEFRKAMTAMFGGPFPEEAHEDEEVELMEEENPTGDVVDDYYAPTTTPLAEESPSRILSFASHLALAVDRFISERPKVTKTKDLKEQDRERGSSLKWWHDNKSRFPLVSKLAQRVLTAQGTQSDVERNWSHGGHILNNLRLSMSPKMFHMILFLYENREMWINVDAALIFGHKEDD